MKADRITHVEAHVIKEIPTKAQGIRCPATHGLEFDHIKPFALGGESLESNLRLTCKPHNLLNAENAFGKEFMKQCFQRLKLRERGRLGRF